MKIKGLTSQYDIFIVLHQYIIDAKKRSSQIFARLKVILI
jgi:hypothetical protein